jgi:threonine aldolase
MNELFDGIIPSTQDNIFIIWSHPMEIVDLRSDTVTQPTPEMRQAMANAPVGDDVFGEDPTINRLQEMAAERMGKEAGLFVSSGTMGNLLAVLTHCGRGDEAIMGNLGHTFLFEAGGISALGGVHSCQLPNQPDGTIKLEDLWDAFRNPDDVHSPTSRLLILENTHNRCGGVVLSPEYTTDAAELVHRHGLKLHLDGARIFNAAAYLSVPARMLAAPADSVTFCLSKGLCAPVGSVLCGSREFIDQARHIRKQLGGGMRQAGILAAAGIIALEKMTGRLSEDHQRARLLAEGLAEIPGLIPDTLQPQTNMVFINLSRDVRMTAKELTEKLIPLGVKVSQTGKQRMRLVTHYWIDDAAVQKAIQAFKQVM